MELQLILSGGFLFLGGLMLTSSGAAFSSAGPFLAVMGLIPLLLFYFRSFTRWLNLHYPPPDTQTKKEDSNENT